jgi:hypothetical protein
MNRNDHFTQTLEAWLRREAPSQAPDRLLAAALDRVATESQRRSWLQRFVGETPLASATRLAALTAVIGLAVLVGLQFANLLPDVGEPSPSPSASADAPASQSAEASPSATPAAACVGPPLDLALLIRADPVACFGDAALTVDGEIIAGVADCPVIVEPVWLSCPQTLLGLVGETRKVGAPMLTVASDPASGISLGDANTAVRVTGHFDDPAAQTCQVTEPLPSSLGGTPEPQSVIIERCRTTFVVTEVVPLAANPTGTLIWVAGAAGGPGMSVSEAIAGAPSEQVLVNGWLLIDGFGRTWLCEAISDSTPPRFDGPRLLVENYPDASSPDFQEADGVRWLTDAIQLFGNVSIP